jgi:hypothetical protein
VDLTQVFGAFLQGGFGTSSGSVGASASAQATLPQ